MAESRGSLLAKSVQKHAGRAKEKVSDLIFYFFSSNIIYNFIFNSMIPTVHYKHVLNRV